MTQRIHLIRHGQPACRPQAALSRQDYRCWVEAYDAAGIMDWPPNSLVKWLESAGIDKVISSSLPRASESARALLKSDRVYSDPLFNEAAITIPTIPLRMNSSAWTAIGRITWLCGAPADEDITAFRLRARAATEKLMQSEGADETALIGHGWMNRMIGHNLRKRGFQIQYRSYNGYWSRTTLVR
ncbi:histidine phosphatase family protein [Bradyrhizobium sp. CB2312]|uniref:histidine phosphatase family protein n=1 Tax=Bradyrhizobium sp. CB2312 TaxID=3039155 RepID=UPI0024B22AC5|nr:histidine phosphatase family protein [Bradyrhizobium sp. CB2312]WFU72226.1 phosphoglycerate mutase family protein [Bradyrhizobium sp. CB2312]